MGSAICIMFTFKSSVFSISGSRLVFISSLTLIPSRLVICPDYSKTACSRNLSAKYFVQFNSIQKSMHNKIETL